MYYAIKVVSNAQQNCVIANADGSLTVRTTATPERGKANKRVRQLLAEHLRVPAAAIGIVKGKYHSRKVIHIDPTVGRQAEDAVEK